VKLEWSPLAVADRDAIFDYIQLESPRAAVMVDERIGDRVTLLLRHPEAGRIGRVEGTRELVIGGTPYIAAYRILAGRIQVIRLLHGAQLWPEEFDD
jgi:toxin ParE1/3/4